MIFLIEEFYSKTKHYYKKSFNHKLSSGWVLASQTIIKINTKKNKNL